MEDGVAEFCMAGAREFHEVLDDERAIARDEARHDGVVEAIVELAITREVAAIEQGDGEFEVIGVEAFALGEIAGGRAEFEAQVPNFLRESADGGFQFFASAIAGVQKQNINVGIREQPSAAEAAQRDEGEIGGAIRLGRDQFPPQAAGDGFDKGGSACDGGAAVARGVEILLEAREFLRIEIAEFSGERGFRGHGIAAAVLGRMQRYSERSRRRARVRENLLWAA